MEEVLKDMLLASSSSSSSSSYTDSSDDEFFEMQRIFFQGINKRHRLKNFITDVVNKYSETEFCKNFRVSRKTADMLINTYQNSTHYKTKKRGGRKVISAEIQILAFLWFTGNKDTYRGVANLFNMSIFSVHRHIGHVIEFLFEISPNYIKLPTTDEEKKEKADAFAQLAGIKGVIGCIDGCYIYIRKPVKKIASTYVNRHGLLSMTMQAICDADKRFIDVCVGSPSKIHDARIFKLSYISKDLPKICGEEYHVLGDAAYPLRTILLTPYKDYGNLTYQQKTYNKKHCQTRVKIENAFGLLKQRFRQLVRLDFFNVDKMCKFVMGCCVLHNMCIDEDDLWEEQEESEDALGKMSTPNAEHSDTADIEVSQAVLKHLGELKRKTIVNSL